MRKNSSLTIAALALAGSLVAISPAAYADDAKDQTLASRGHDMVQHFLDYFHTPTQNPATDQDKAAQLARDGKYDEALSILGPLYQKNPMNLSVGRDYAAILGWAGRDTEAVKVYEAIPANEPDYVLASVGHSYRRLNQTDKALAVYRRGLDNYPDSETFAEGEIRCLADKDDYDSAFAKANENVAKYGERPAIVSVRQDVATTMMRLAEDKAVSLARAGQYQESLNILSDLHGRHEDNVNITRDYLSVLSWSGSHDDVVVYLFNSLPPDAHTDYVLSAAAVAYRRMNQPDKALAIYEEGLSKYPDSVIFAEGQIRSLADMHKYDEAMAKAKADIAVHGQRPEIVAAMSDVQKWMPKKKKTRRKGHSSAGASHHHHRHHY